MAPKKRMELLVLLGSNVVPIPNERHTWPTHPIAKGSFWKRVMNDIVEAGSPFEFVDSKSPGAEHH